MRASASREDRAAPQTIDVDDLVRTGVELLEANRPVLAEVPLRQAAQLGSPLAVFNLACALAQQSRWDEALALFKEAASVDVHGAWLHVGHVLRELDKPDAAEDAYNNAADAGDLDGLVELAFLLRERGDQYKATQLAEIAADAGNPLAAAVLAAWRWQETQDVALEAPLREGAEVYQDARAALSHLLRVTDRMTEARQLLEAGTQLNEKGAWLPLGNLLLDVFDDSQAAEVAYRGGIAAGDAHSHHNLAQLLEARGDREQAIEHYRAGAARGDELADAALKRLT